ncbi:RpiR family transcriptional regulator [Pseudoxanthomonas dokdonensis]|uniref:RpiR family transcriptional regulator n=1 Tax=Pseudoxanthomonas dokdonensis TaxID=344882 RepID=A0A0R0CDZ0_9GAMM|nr:RpiR family transcriptional regulator [Pseudoxanthomonas dokdonensis]
MDLIYQLKQRLHQLSPVEARIAHSILADVSLAAQLGVSELAERAQVSVAAVSRFAKTMGYDNVRELRAQLAEASAVGKRFLQQEQAPAVSALHAQICDDIESTLRHNLALLREDTMLALAGALAGARMIHVFGMGGCSALFAQELQNRLMRFGCRIAACNDAVSMKMIAATLGADDVVMALSVSGITPEILSAVDIARGYGARIGSITRRDTPLAAASDWWLELAIDETDFVFKPTASRYAMLLAIDVLSTTLGLHTAQASQEHLRRIKLALDNYRGGDNRLPLGD